MPEFCIAFVDFFNWERLYRFAKSQNSALGSFVVLASFAGIAQIYSDGGDINAFQERIVRVFYIVSLLQLLFMCACISIEQSVPPLIKAFDSFSSYVEHTMEREGVILRDLEEEWRAASFGDDTINTRLISIALMFISTVLLVWLFQELLTIVAPLVDVEHQLPIEPYKDEVAVVHTAPKDWI